VESEGGIVLEEGVDDDDFVDNEEAHYELRSNAKEEKSRPGAANVCLEHSPLASRSPYSMWNQRAALYGRKEWTMMTMLTTRKPITSFEAMPRRKIFF
jgi:hypothetical protein